jgi:hypothetical protein
MRHVWNRLGVVYHWTRRRGKKRFASGQSGHKGSGNTIELVASSEDIAMRYISCCRMRE